MRKHRGKPFRRDKHVTPAAISPPGVARGRFVGGQQSGLAGCKPPPLFTRGASSCSSQGQRQGESRGASPRPSAPTYLPLENFFSFFGIHSSQFNGLPRRKASPLYRFVTHIPSHGSAGQRVGRHTGVPPKGEGQCKVEG